MALTHANFRSPAGLVPGLAALQAPGLPVRRLWRGDAVRDDSVLGVARSADSDWGLASGEPWSSSSSSGGGVFSQLDMASPLQPHAAPHATAGLPGLRDGIAGGCGWVCEMFIV
jgi:hypothetical protein